MKDHILFDSKHNSFRNTLVHASAWLVLVWERLWPLLVPTFIITGVFLVFSWLGGWYYLQLQESPILLWIARIFFSGLFLASLWPLQNFVLPVSTMVMRRVEDASLLKNRPLTTRKDALAMGRKDVFSRVLWHSHRTRISKELKDLTAGSPSPEAGRLDPYGLRMAVPLLVFAAFCFSFSPYGGRIIDFYQTRIDMQLATSRIDAWIAPPAYTRKSAIYLTLAENADMVQLVTAPQGSEFFLRYIGAGDISMFTRSGNIETPTPPKELEQGKPDREFSIALRSDVTIVLMLEGKAVSQWKISLVSDNPPEIRFFEEPGAALSGSLQLTYSVKDDYGVVGGQAIIDPVEVPDKDARPLFDAPKIDLPLSGIGNKLGVSKLNRDLTHHPWAGNPVRLTLKARDGLDQIGTSQTREIILPSRQFSKPLALALLEQRRILAMDANKRIYVANLLDSVSTAPDRFVSDVAARIGMRVAYRRLINARTDDELRSALDLLWEIALGIEFGDLSEAERRLREARERLSNALESGAPGNEIDRLMQELREAMKQMMQALAEQAQKNPQTQNPFAQQNTQALSQRDLQKMLDQIENLAKSGLRDAARQMLSEMQRVMDNLRMGRHEQQQQAEGNALNRNLDKLSELMQNQQALMNETHNMQQQKDNRQGGDKQTGNQQQQNNHGPGQNRQNGNQNRQSQPGQMQSEEIEHALEQLRQQQEALQQQLGSLGKQLEKLGFGELRELGEARREMGKAGKNLGQGDPGNATIDQAQALDALRRGAQNMIQQMAGDRQQGGQRQFNRGGLGQPGGRGGVDPLGRQFKTDGFEADSRVKIPDEIDAQRARKILETIRKRLANPGHPMIERDYLERLLRSE